MTFLCQQIQFPWSFTCSQVKCTIPKWKWTILHFLLSHSQTIPVWKAGAPAASEGCEAIPLVRKFRTFLLTTGFLHTRCHCGTFPQRTGYSSSAFKNFPRIMGQIPAKGLALTWIILGRHKVKEKKASASLQGTRFPRLQELQLYHNGRFPLGCAFCYLPAFDRSSLQWRKLPSAQTVGFVRRKSAQVGWGDLDQLPDAHPATLPLLNRIGMVCGGVWIRWKACGLR